MKIVEIEGCTDYIAENQPEYETLPIKRMLLFDTETGFHSPVMLSEWKPDAEDITKIVMGAPLRLSVLGVIHPPVMIEVGEIPPTASTMDVEGGTAPSQLLFKWGIYDGVRTGKYDTFEAPNVDDAKRQASEKWGIPKKRLTGRKL